jgi:Leucine-rich repeat (LRR) protein
MKMLALLLTILLVPFLLKAQIVHIPDANFKAALVDNSSINTNGDDEVQVSEAEAYSGAIYVYNRRIADLTGLEAFVALTTLSCGSNRLTNLDVSANTKLNNLSCGENQLTSLDVGANTALEIILCGGNELTSLDVSANLELAFLRCYSNQLASLDVSANTALQELRCNSNQLTSLDLSANAALTNLYFGNNQVTALNVSANTALTSLECHSNQLTSLDVSANTRLTSLDCSDNQLTSLDVSANTVLTSLSCSGNQLTSLDVSANTALAYLSCSYNQLTSLDLSANTALIDLSCWSNQLTSVDVSANTALTSLSCYSNQLTGLDVSANTALRSLECHYNQLTSMDISTNKNLDYLDFSNNELTSLDISTNKRLEYLDFSNNQLTSLDASANSSLEELYCNNNQLTSLDVKANLLLESLWCFDNQLTSLDVRENLALKSLYCYHNQLTSLDVSSNVFLGQLICNSNELSSLNLRNGNNHRITGFDATGNPSLACIAVNDVAFAEANWTNIDEGVIFSEGGCNVYIPDANFKAALLADAAINTNNDSEVQYGEAEAYTGTIDVASLGISDMTGLEAFKSVTGLNCSANNLIQLNIRFNNRLESIDCSNNELTSLDVGINLALEALNCGSNQLKGFSLSTNNNLRQLDCQSNQLEQLDLSVNVNLTELYCQSNQLRSLDVKNGNNEQITAFDARNNPSLSCIAVDDAAYSAANWPNVDVQGLFNQEGCAVVYIPDAGFKAALLANTGINTNGDTEIQVSEAKAYTGDIQVPSTGISDMTGLQAFTNLTALDCSGNQLSELDVKANELLTQLNCKNNQLSRLALRSNPLLEQLDCSNNQLGLLDLRMNNVLKEVLCQSNQLHSLDLRNGANEAITAFDATDNPPLACISVDDADYATANWTMIDAGTVFSEGGCNVYIPDSNFKAALVGNSSINSNRDDEIQVSEAEAYTGGISVYSKSIADMTGLEAFVALTTLNCWSNQLTSLDVSANTALTTLDCQYNQLTSLDVSSSTSLQYLYCWNNLLPALDVSANASLQELRCQNNHLTELDVSANASLQELRCHNNHLTELDVSANTALTSLHCGSNQLTSLDVSANTLLERLYCGRNQLTSLDVSANTKLSYFFCSENQLYSLNVRNGNNAQITLFFASGNPFLSCITVSDEAHANANWTDIDAGTTFSEGGCNVYIPDANFKTALVANGSINTNGDDEIQFGEADAYTGSIEVENLAIADMTGLEAFKSITGLNCAGNELTQLVLRYHAALESVDCSGNQLDALDMKANEALKSLNCASNQLTSLDVRNGHNTQITEFDATNNSSLNCISVDDANYSTVNWTNIDAHTSFNGDCYFIADFVADETSGLLPLEVQFTDRSDNTATSWQWDFGDGNTSEEQSPNHTYTVAGTYTVMLTISNGYKINIDSKIGYIDVLKRNQTITFEALDNKTFGDADFDLTATASSGLDVSYSSSDLTVATIDGSTVTIVGAGTTTITASQAGDGNYLAATEVQQTLTVEKAAQTITFGALDNKTFGDADFGLTATVSSGLDVSYTSSDLTVTTIDGSTVTIVGAGTTTITASQAGDGNYLAATEVQQTLTVDKAAQTITFGALDNKTFGDADFGLTATVSSGLDVSYTSSDLTVTTIDGSTVNIIGAGTTTITASQAGDDNYLAATEVQQTLTVEKAAQTITFGALDNKTFGDADFGLTATASSSLDVSYTSSDLTVATIDGNTVTIVGAGTTTITASQAGNENYLAATEVQQTLTVEKAAQTITFEALDNKTFGDADFDLTATASSDLDVSYTSSDLTVATIDGSTVTIVGAGTTTIAASQAGDDNYIAATEVQQTLTVEKAAQTITFGALDNKTFGDADFDLRATASSGLDVSYTSSDLTVATIDGSTVNIIGAGTTTITASQTGNDNYNAADPVEQTLEVMEITALTVEEDDRILVYPNPASSTMILQFESGMRSVRMLNLNGQTVYEKHGIDKLAGRLEIDTSTYPPGEYIIRFEGKGKTTARKVLISR